jgi:hypothetical protein
VYEKEISDTVTSTPVAFVDDSEDIVWLKSIAPTVGMLPPRKSSKIKHASILFIGLKAK